jgi:hypothetical protein
VYVLCVRTMLLMRCLLAARRIKSNSAPDSLAMQLWWFLVCAMAAIDEAAMNAHGRSEPVLRVAMETRIPSITFIFFLEAANYICCCGVSSTFRCILFFFCVFW